MIVQSRYTALALSILLLLQSSFATEPLHENDSAANGSRGLKSGQVRVAISCDDNQSLQECEDAIAAALRDANYFEIKYRLTFLHVISLSIDASDKHLLSSFDMEESGERYWMPISGSTKIATEHQLQSEQSIQYGIDMVQATDFWEEYGVKGKGVKVCVIDSGIDTDHEDLGSVNGTGVNYPTRDWWKDTSGHGTHVSGIVAALDNNVGVVGVAPEAAIFVVKITYDLLPTFLTDDLLAALEACYEAGSNIINMSLGGYNYMRLEERAMDALFLDKNILVVASAGNDRSSTYSYPASYSSVLSVAAVDSDGFRAPFSNYNDQVDFAAPGVDILSTIPGNQYELKDGTSMASPHVAGVGALLMSRVGTDFDVEEIVDAMRVSADNPFDFKSFDYGFGIVKAVDAMKRLDYTINNIEFVLYMETASSGTETSWSLIDHTTEIVIESGDGYDSFFSPYTESFILDAHRCYTWVIHSENGNGFDGYYDIYVDDELVKTGFDFSKHDSITFGNCKLSELVIELKTDSNASDLMHSLRIFNANEEIWSDFNLENFQTYTTAIPVDFSVCYKYEITDSGGDGIAPDGNLRILLDGNLLVNRGDFGYGGVKSIGSCPRS